MMKRFITLLIVAVLVTFSLSAFAQESAVKGNLSGTVYDSTGAVVAGAKITMAGPIGAKQIETDNEGHFLFPLLTPGFYTVKVEKQGFKTTETKGVEVATNKTVAIRLTLEPGAVSEVVEVSAPAVTVDTSTTAVGTNLTDSFYTQIPTTRNVTGLFYVAPGAVSSGSAGNPSISGGSALENQYVADGVNITDGAFGGIGVFSRLYGSLSTGINLSFIQEVQVKSGGYEPQYGKTTGGIVQIVTKSGTSSYHGAVGAYFAPQGLEASRLQPDFGGTDLSQSRFNQGGQINHQGGFDVSGEVGGYVPGFKDKLFFFGSFNPSWNRDYFTYSNHHGLAVTPGSPAAGLGTGEDKSTSYNYAAKLTWKINQNHTLEGSVFGDPTRSPMQNGAVGSYWSLTVPNDTVFSEMKFGTRNVVVRYNGTLSPTWLVNASAAWGHNYLQENPLDPSLYGLTVNINDPNNSTSPLPDPALMGPIAGYQTWDSVTPSPANCPVSAPCVTTGGYTLQGRGFLENTEGNNYGFALDTQKQFHFLGSHNFSIGYKLDRSFYDGARVRTGGLTDYPLTNYRNNSTASWAPNELLTSPYGFDFGGYVRWCGAAVAVPDDNTTNCPLWPLLDNTGNAFAYVPVYLRQNRGEFGNPDFFTSGTYHAIYGMDSWSPWKYLTINAGLRWEQQYMQGTYNPVAGATSNYTWVGNWSPRIGVVVDPWGDRKTKVFVNFGRYNYAIPLDMAIRSLSNEQDVYRSDWMPHWNLEPAAGGRCDVAPFANINGGCGNTGTGAGFVAFNTDGTILNPTLAAGWLRSSSGSNSSFGLSSQTAIAPGTKMESLDEWVVGFEHDFGHGVIFTARYVDRRMKRIVEDLAGVSPEAANLGVVQQFMIGNPGPKTDLFVNPIQEQNWTPSFAGDGSILTVSGYTNTDAASPLFGLPCNPDGSDPNCSTNNNGAIAQLLPSGCFADYNPATGFNVAGDGPAGIPFYGQVTNSNGQVVLPGGTVATGAAGTGLCVLPNTSWNGVVNYGGHEPGDVFSDGIPEGFVQPTRNYQAMEFEVNKSFSKNWQIRANYRIAKLKGNYEGAFRNDNGQTDPSISSLFDFTAGNYFLLGDQFATGYLNTDRRHVVNTYFSYVFDKYFLKGLTIGTGVRVQSGQPINELLAHPVYANAGEVPLHGRGALGRLPTTGQIDMHVDYAFAITEKSKLRFGMDLFNLVNMKRLTGIDQNRDRSYGVANADFLKPVGNYTGFQRPFYGRLMVKWEF